MSKEIKKQLDEEAVGKTFEDIPEEEMQEVQGAGDVDLETTPFAISATVAFSAGVLFSKKRC